MFRNQPINHKIASTLGLATVNSTVSASMAVLTESTFIEWISGVYIVLQVTYLLWKWRVDWKHQKMKRQRSADHA
ncbi:hypothetical protein [Xylella fastidiosa]|uniref:Uncharacterized protein n=1 Tax=Xylella fastidiosa subsp. sandyi Ann-1 TaxID=155920 RepID=A0A060HD57_XYLFS|nr:hypothetical protein [Xylella fastidiosa]AIC11321.1 hypothetical protein D934_07790 [Xylella fastidiosa subsp. sandyi Ann-1]AIC11406.1 hypothetical protein D934_09010 [Xylella fastidiosa subsp. sandyi Ann-1]UIX80393.1 hypothetical protein LZ756_07690 [Xylella fastidiosa subsp. sandyi]UIX82041.1 hypothetical protein LZ756_04055 [Xylella fastidiosa subsp. sandyi]